MPALYLSDVALALCSYDVERVQDLCELVMNVEYLHCYEEYLVAHYVLDEFHWKNDQLN